MSGPQYPLGGHWPCVVIKFWQPGGDGIRGVMDGEIAGGDTPATGRSIPSDLDQRSCPGTPDNLLGPLRDDSFDAFNISVDFNNDQDVNPDAVDRTLFDSRVSNNLGQSIVQPWEHGVFSEFCSDEAPSIFPSIDNVGPVVQPRGSASSSTAAVAGERMASFRPSL